MLKPSCIPDRQQQGSTPFFSPVRIRLPPHHRLDDELATHLRKQHDSTNDLPITSRHHFFRSHPFPGSLVTAIAAVGALILDSVHETEPNQDAVKAQLVAKSKMAAVISGQTDLPPPLVDRKLDEKSPWSWHWNIAKSVKPGLIMIDVSVSKLDSRSRKHEQLHSFRLVPAGDLASSAKNLLAGI